MNRFRIRWFSAVKYYNARYSQDIIAKVLENQNENKTMLIEMVLPLIFQALYILNCYPYPLPPRIDKFGNFKKVPFSNNSIRNDIRVYLKLDKFSKMNFFMSRKNIYSKQIMDSSQFKMFFNHICFRLFQKGFVD